jgi:hypothetical protein
MHDDYSEKNPENPISYKFYRKRIHKMNISFTKLGCKQCEFCDRAKLNDLSITDLDRIEHKRQYKTACIEYQLDVELYNLPSSNSTKTI